MPQDYPKMLSFEKGITPQEQNAYAMEWSRLVSENAPLRAIVNGHLYSVPINFYDSFLRREIPDKEFRSVTAIGNALGHGPIGISDWWYARRLRAMLASGELEFVKKDKAFYKCIIRKAK